MPVNSKHTNIGPRLSIVDKKGSVIARLGGEHGPGQETGRFLSPHGLAVDSKGDIYVGEVSYTNWSEHPSRRAGAEVPALAAEAREGGVNGGLETTACT